MRTVTILVAAAVGCAAQFAPRPEADSPEEFDGYLAALEAKTPEAVIAAGDAFVRAWPQSALRGHVYELQFEAYRLMDNSSKAIEAGQNSLSAVPDNLIVLAKLSVVLANGTSDEKRLARSEAYARKAISLSKSIRIPKFIEPAEWSRIDGRVNSQAHAALGLVANQRGDAVAAIRAFETAVSVAPEPDATQYYRLGMLYAAAKNVDRAREKLRLAAESDEPAVRQLAKRELRRLDQLQLVP